MTRVLGAGSFGVVRVDAVLGSLAVKTFHTTALLGLELDAIRMVEDAAKFHGTAWPAGLVQACNGFPRRAVLMERCTQAAPCVSPAAALRQVMSACAALWRMGFLVHMDICPRNLLVRRSGELVLGDVGSVVRMRRPHTTLYATLHSPAMRRMPRHAGAIIARPCDIQAFATSAAALAVALLAEPRTDGRSIDFAFSASTASIDRAAASLARRQPWVARWLHGDLDIAGGVVAADEVPSWAERARRV